MGRFLFYIGFTGNILPEIVCQLHQSPFGAVIELYVSEAGFRLDWSFAAAHLAL